MTTKKHRIDFQSWGRAAPGDGYVLYDADRHLSIAEAIASSIERRTGLVWCGGPRSDGQSFGSEPVALHFTGTLGRPCPGGGYTPQGDCWYSFARTRPI